ncbi:hypothetical protein GFU95_00495 [Apibacter sp. B3889]|uniref:DUF6348 family protein n=1 Tax=unclassified Apibacter TaxID=2630820 RepID=UPI0013222F6D|nr:MULTISPECIES: DUF6348 family protein [unclassified Apibacter]MXO33491.1 hypothetical protein [Apibacter sp. B3883]MXO40848.1 hypothetical protein [Apibacter sp. B3889]MXP04017.1 hypothetical protein [Apibacter sp. B3887]MXP07172.1 hypothetical protein [Apibacter sp. B3935]
MSPQEILANMLLAHDLPSIEYKDWLLVDEQLPAMRAETFDFKEYENGAGIRLDITLLLASKKTISESYLGIGKNKISAIQNAFQNFVANSFHVFLSAFWQITNDDQIGIEEWEIKGKKWKVYIGNFGCKGDFNIPENLFKIIEEQIQEENLEEDLYWLRIYYANVNSREIMIETLKNNEVWPEMENKLKTVAWDSSDKFYSLRNFIILKRK